MMIEYRKRAADVYNHFNNFAEARKYLNFVGWLECFLEKPRKYRCKDRRYYSYNYQLTTDQYLYPIYRQLVRELTKQQQLDMIPGIHLRGKDWHLDHVLSIYEAFKRNVPPRAAAHTSNLRIIPRNENFQKANRTVFTNLFNETLRTA